MVLGVGHANGSDLETLNRRSFASFSSSVFKESWLSIVNI